MTNREKKHKEYLSREAEILECIALDASSILKPAAKHSYLHVLEGGHCQERRLARGK